MQLPTDENVVGAAVGGVVAGVVGVGGVVIVVVVLVFRSVWHSQKTTNVSCLYSYL